MQLFTWEIGPDGEDTVSTMATDEANAQFCILANAVTVLDADAYQRLKSYLTAQPVVHKHRDVFYSFNSDQTCVEEAKNWII